MYNSMKKFFTQLSAAKLQLSGFALSTFYFIFSTPVYAQGSIGDAAGGSFRDVVIAVIKFISSSVVPLLVAVTFVIVLFNLVRYVGAGDSEQERTKFRDYTLWSLLAFFIILSIFGLIQIASNTIFNGGAIVIPQFPTE